MDSDLESKLISLFTQLLYMIIDELYKKSWFRSQIIQIVSLVRSLDLESQQKPESEFMSLIAQTKSVFKSMDLDSQPKPLFKLISRFTQLLNPTNSDSVAPNPYELKSLVYATSSLEPEPKLISLIYQILSLVVYMKDSKDENLISLCPQAEVSLGYDNILYIVEEDLFRREYYKWRCLLYMKWLRVRLAGGEGGSSYFFCEFCKGQNHHERYEKAPVEIKHPLHPKHSLRLVALKERDGRKRKCYCCDEYLSIVIYCCLACDYAMNIACVKRPPVLSRDRPKWHEHTLSLFPRKASLTCNLCGLADSSCPFYICPPCDFSVHQNCLSLPNVIQISPHRHRISFKASFSHGSFSCGVCRKQIHNDYGGYSCIKKGCSYVAHSRCATQNNVWDGEDLEGVPEEIEEILEPFVRILSHRIIKHFGHQHHHLRLEDNTVRDYDENRQCHACTTPIYFGNYYSCLQCDFILHEGCANLARKIHHPMHPHMLTLVGECDGVYKDYSVGSCSACSLICSTGFFYKCGKEECEFKVHVQCGTISEPLVHRTHIHPLFLTSKPEEKKKCSVCNRRTKSFNCIECNFSLCFLCATLPQKVRYKHDKHMLSLSYGERTSTMAFWCEVCEENIDPQERFYMCHEDCSVTLHLNCMIGKDLYMKIGSSWFSNRRKVEVAANNQHMSRPFCYKCRKRCTEKIVMKLYGYLIFCSVDCTYGYI